jgi:hypothetical protein
MPQGGRVGRRNEASYYTGGFGIGPAEAGLDLAIVESGFSRTACLY